MSTDMASTVLRLYLPVYIISRDTSFVYLHSPTFDDLLDESLLMSVFDLIVITGGSNCKPSVKIKHII